MSKRLILAITGASGALYVLEFLKLLAELEVELHAIISGAGEKVLRLETGLGKNDLPGVRQWYAIDDFTAPMASGSSPYEAMIVLPCTMGTLAAIASGLSQNLIHRSADVTLKEKRPLLLAVRETPLNRTHLRNMLTAHDAGATIFPAMPAFYHKPENISEMARDFCCRLADQLGLEIKDRKRWQGL